MGEPLRGGLRLAGALATDVLAETLSGLSEVALVDDVVAIKDAARRVSQQGIATRSGMPGRIRLRAAVRTAVMQATPRHTRQLTREGQRFFQSGITPS